MAIKKMDPKKAGIPDIGQNYIPPGGIPLYVGGGGDSWQSIANRQGISAKQLIEFNYKTSIPEVVNFYLERNCGCKKLAADGKNYSFATASPGVIYAPPAVTPVTDPVILFQRHTIMPLEMRPHPQGQGMFELTATFTVHVVLNSKLPDPSLYEYRQEIRGHLTKRTGKWVGEVWQPEGDPSNLSNWFKIPGNGNAHPNSVNSGLQPYWKEDGLIEASGAIYRFGHRENPPHPSGELKDVYSAGGYQYQCADRPGISKYLIKVGDQFDLKVDFIGSVVKFDKKPGVSGRKIVSTVAKKDWTYACKRRIKYDSPLVPVPY